MSAQMKNLAHNAGDPRFDPELKNLWQRSGYPLQFPLPENLQIEEPRLQAIGHKELAMTK